MPPLLIIASMTVGNMGNLFIIGCDSKFGFLILSLSSFLALRFSSFLGNFIVSLDDNDNDNAPLNFFMPGLDTSPSTNTLTGLY